MKKSKRNYWLVKSEPFKYSWDDFVLKGRDHWDGVRNYQARNNMMEMKVDDLVFFYHSNEGKEIVGLAKVVKEHYPDPTIEDDRWQVVDLVPVQKLPRAISLEEIKKEPLLQNMVLLKNSRLSVQPVRSDEFDLILQKTHA